MKSCIKCRPNPVEHPSNRLLHIVSCKNSLGTPIIYTNPNLAWRDSGIRLHKMPEILKSKEEKSKFNGTDGRIMSGKASFKEKRRLITPMHCVCNWVKDVEAFLNFRKATNRQVFIFGEVEDFLLGADEFGITFGLCAIDLRMSVFKNTIKRASKEGAWEIQMDLALCLLEFKSEVYSSDGELFRVNPNGALDLAYLRSYLPRMEVKTQWDKVIRM